MRKGRKRESWDFFPRVANINSDVDKKRDSHPWNRQLKCKVDWMDDELLYSSRSRMNRRRRGGAQVSCCRLAILPKNCRTRSSKEIEEEIFIFLPSLAFLPVKVLLLLLLFQHVKSHFGYYDAPSLSIYTLLSSPSGVGCPWLPGWRWGWPRKWTNSKC